MFKLLFVLAWLLLDKRRTWCKVITCLVVLTILSEKKLKSYLIVKY